MEPLIGLWWWTDEGDLLGLRCLTFSKAGITLGIWRTIGRTHESAWARAIPHTSPYYDADPSSFIKGWVNYNTALSRYEVLSDDEDLLHQEDFKKAVIKEFHLENQFIDWVKHTDPVSQWRKDKDG